MVSPPEFNSEMPKSRPADGVSRRNFMIRAGSLAGSVLTGAGGAMAAVALGGSTGSHRNTLPTPIPFSDDDPLRVAIIGAGNRMTHGLLPHLLKRSDVRITICADPNPRNLNATLSRIERATGSSVIGLTGEADALAAARHESVQAILCATPCDLHASILESAMTAGKPIYCEKPACISPSEIIRLRAARSASTSLVQIGLQRRSSPRYLEGVNLIAAGEIGEPMDARAACAMPRAVMGRPGDREWLAHRERSGDWMIEQACHTWDVFNWVAGALPIRATGFGRRDVFKTEQPHRNVTDYYVAMIEYPGGMTVNFTHSWIAPKGDNGAFSGVYERVCGSRGGVDLSSGRVSYSDGAAPRSLEPDSKEMTALALDDFISAIREGRSPQADLDAALDATLVGLLVRKAVDERRPVAMEEILDTLRQS